MLYHASPISNIKTLIPHISNHGEPLIYLSEKRENTLVYLSNAVEKYCKETGFKYDGIWQKWASYGFNKEGVLCLDEYYPNATADTYKGASGYIYYIQDNQPIEPLKDIPYAFISRSDIDVVKAEFIPDAYEAILKAASERKIIAKSYSENSPKMLNWIEKIVNEDYQNAADHPEYRHFLKNHFDFLQ